MDFPKENHFKKKLAPSVPHTQPKSTPRLSTRTPVQSIGKGKVRIEQYEYEEENILGHGYTSQVYLGRLVDNNRSQFAIKVVDKKKISKSKENLQLLKQEMQIHKQLDHPNIVKCYDIIEKNNHYYFVLEYCPHGTLDSFIKKHQKISESVTISIMEQVIAGYKYLMQMKVLHRDLKPPNILKSGPNWKICDFGFSIMGKKNLIGDINVGTPAYMAPESLQRTFYSPKTDFFALGVLCYEMLFGATPWHHKNEKILLQMIKQKKFDHEHFSDYKNKNLVNFILKCCNTNERKRMSMQEFESFSFWKEEQSGLTEREARQFLDGSRPFCKTSGTVKDYSSTCHSQTSNTSYAPQSRIDRNAANQQVFKGNSAVMERQLYYATLISQLMKNHPYLLFQDPEQKELFLTVFAKHARYILRRLKHQTINFLCLKRWNQYCSTEDYKRLKKQAIELQANINELTNNEIKRKTIVTIRLVNKKFDELTYDQNLSAPCIANLREYLVTLMKKTVQRYENVGRAYITQNSWTAQVLDYLLQYNHYVKELGSTTQQSRILALKQEGKSRFKIKQTFQASTVDFKHFQSIKSQIEAIQS